MRTNAALVMISMSLSWASPSVVMAASSFSIENWTQNVKSAPAAQKRQMLDVVRTSQRALKRSETAERKAMREARDLFAKDKFALALEKYNQVPRGADQWLEAVEEKGWVYHREKDFEKTLAQTKTLLSEPFVSIVGSEPFFLQSLTYLKICDYKGVLETHKLFKDTQRARLLELKALSKSGTNDALESVIAKAETFPLTFTQVGEAAKRLPRLFYRDMKFQQALLEMKLADVAQGLVSDAKSLNQYKKISAEGRKRLTKRVQELADLENEQNFKMLQKINLIEVETIQRLHADKNLDKNSFRQGQFAKVGPDQLVFPDDGHPWVDELDKYQVQSNSCPQDIRRKM